MTKRVRETFYPSDQELFNLADINDYATLSKRLNDRTSKNQLKDAIARRDFKKHLEVFPIDILIKIATFMNLGQVMFLSYKCVSFYLCVTNDREFWRNRFILNFPEMIHIAGNELNYDGLTWRNYYRVVQKFINRARLAFTSIGQEVVYENLKFDFSWSASGNMLYKRVCTSNGSIIKDYYEIEFEDLLKNHFNQTLINYLTYFMDIKMHDKFVTTFFIQSIKGKDYTKKYKLCKKIDNRDSYSLISLYDVIKRGFIHQNQ